MPEAKKPDSDFPNVIPTLNAMGWMAIKLDKFSQEFVDNAASAPGPVVDIGAAYGQASIAALKTGAKVIANDIEPGHLEILKREAPAQYLPNLELKLGAFPDGVNFAPESVGAFLSSSVFHFLDGPTVERGIKKMFNALAKGGRAYIITISPHMGGQPFLPAYDKRVAEKTHEWPGFFDNIHELGGALARKSLPPQIHFFDVDTLRPVFEKAGFVVEKAEMFAKPDLPPIIQNDGKEFCGFVVRKPL